MGVVGRGAVGVSANTSALDIITTITMMIILMMIMRIAMIAMAIRMQPRLTVFAGVGTTALWAECLEVLGCSVDSIMKDILYP